jgi:hypothetical protein
MRIPPEATDRCFEDYLISLQNAKGEYHPRLLDKGLTEVLHHEIG